jgi:hypothetical protein
MDLVLANSKLTQKGFSTFGTSSEVVYPFIRLSSYKVLETTKEFIVVVNPLPLKGINIVFQIAENLLQERFLIVGRNGPELHHRLPQNVVYWGMAW